MHATRAAGLFFCIQSEHCFLVLSLLLQWFLLKLSNIVTTYIDICYDHGTLRDSTLSGPSYSKAG